jgi:hypothetical protein
VLITGVIRADTAVLRADAAVLRADTAVLRRCNVEGSVEILGFAGTDRLAVCVDLYLSGEKANKSVRPGLRDVVSVPGGNCDEWHKGISHCSRICCCVKWGESTLSVPPSAIFRALMAGARAVTRRLRLKFRPAHRLLRHIYRWCFPSFHLECPDSV